MYAKVTLQDNSEIEYNNLKSVLYYDEYVMLTTALDTTIQVQLYNVALFEKSDENYILVIQKDCGKWSRPMKLIHPATFGDKAQYSTKFWERV